jgi:hypothetical protein
MLFRCKRMPLIFLPMLLLASTGCNAEDAARLGQIGRLIAARAESLSGGPNGKLSTGWQVAKSVPDEPSPVERVKARLRWDKALANIPIDVQGDGSTVRLNGKIGDQKLKSLAVELTQSTAGVDKVLDSLQVSSSE